MTMLKVELVPILLKKSASVFRAIVAEMVFRETACAFKGTQIHSKILTSSGGVLVVRTRRAVREPWVHFFNTIRHRLPATMRRISDAVTSF